MPATGPDVISLQARDLDAWRAFYEQDLGPFGRTFTFTDPDGHPVTLHDWEINPRGGW